MDNITSRTLAILSGLAMVLSIYIGVTLLKGWRVDLTEESLYTVSDGSKALMAALDSPVKLKLYYSKTAANQGTEGLRTFNNYFVYVTEVLKQLQAHSRNNITIEVIDPRPDTPEEEDAVAYGLRKFNLTESERYFFGLVAENESGTEKIIEFFDPAQKDKLEYDLTKLIYTVQHPEKKTIGIISSLPVVTEDLSPYMAQIMQMQGKPVGKSWLVAELLKELYTVKKIEPGTDKISGIDLLIAIHPTGFPEPTLFAMDQFLLGGGNMMVFVDPKPLVAARQNPMARMGGASPAQGASPDPGFAQLMASWGIALVPGQLVADRALSPTGQFSPNQPPTTLLALVNCTDACSTPYRDPITAGLGQLNLVYPGELTVTATGDKANKDLTITTILTTTKTGNGYRASPRELEQPMALLSKFKDGDSAKILGVKVTGTFTSAFPGGITVTEAPKDQRSPSDPAKPAANGEGKTVTKTGLTKSSRPAAVVVFSDVDMLHDSMAFKNSFLGPVVAGDNSTLFLNGVESLSGNSDLLAVRTKSRSRRSFTVIDAIERRAEAQTADKVAEINSQIGTFEQELAALGAKANAGNLALLQNEGLAKKKQLVKTIAGLKKELRHVKREGREQIETIGNRLRLVNTVAIPFLVILFGIFYLYKRQKSTQRPSGKAIPMTRLKEVPVK